MADRSDHRERPGHRERAGPIRRTTRTLRRRGVLRGVASGLLVLAAAGAVAGFGAAARLRTASDSEGRPPDRLRVELASVEPRDGYEETRQYVGRVEARQESDIGFEIPGAISRVLADEGDSVAAGEPVAELDDERLRSRRAELAARLERAEADRTLARMTYERVRRASGLNAASGQELDEAEQGLARAEAARREASAALRSIDVDLGKTRLRSPFDAVIARRYLDAGRVVNPGEPVLMLLERSTPEARIGLAGDAAEAVGPGDEVSVRIRGRGVTGRVRRLLPIRDTNTRAVDAIIELDASLDGIRRGDLARLAVPRRVERPGFWVPLGALVEGERGLWSIYRYAPSDDEGAGWGRAVRTPVELLSVRDDRAYVRGPVSVGDRFIRGGLQRLSPGMEVVPVGAAGRDGSGREGEAGTPG